MLPPPLFFLASQESVDVFCLITMPPIIPEPPFECLDFCSEFLHGVDFGETFNFGGDFSFLPEVDFLDASSLSDEAFEYDNMSYDLSVKSVVLLRSQDLKCHYWKKCAKNCTNYRASVRTSCWYINNLVPGPVQQLTHELSRSDRYGKFCH
jgi:hypothetical protein